MAENAHQWTQDTYIQQRVDPLIEEFSNKAQGNLRCYRRVKRYETYCAMMLPLLIVLWHFSPAHIIWIQVFIAFDATLVAILSSLAHLGHYLEDATRYSHIKSQLTHEKSLFCTNTGQYKHITKSEDENQNASFGHFVERIESISLA